MTNTKIIKRRSQKEMNATREAVIESLDNLEIPEHKFLGRTNEGLVYENAEGLNVVIRVITKQSSFDAKSEIEEYELRQDLKAQQAEFKSINYWGPIL